VLLNAILAGLAWLSLGLLCWQWVVARRFPLHQRPANALENSGVTLLTPLKGCESTTETCLRSWFQQIFSGPLQILFAVATAADPVCDVVRKLMREFPAHDAQLIICGPLLGANAKISKLAQLESQIKHEIVVISDADVRAPSDLIANLAASLSPSEVGLANCFYRMANPTTAAMRWEAVAINADFWSQVLQAQSLRPIDFALGAVMATRRKQLTEIGGFAGLMDCLADDYQLGHRIARRGYRIVLSPLVVECWSEPMGWAAVWKHQLRWARTIRVCQRLPYFFSILSNPTLWPLFWLMANRTSPVFAFAIVCGLVRIITARDLQHRLTKSRPPFSSLLLPLIKDLLQAALWLVAFTGNHIEWRGERMRLRRDGTLIKTQGPAHSLKS